MITETVEQPKRTGLLIWLIVSQVLAIASLLIWFVGAGMSMMSVDADGVLPQFSLVYHLRLLFCFL